MNRYEATLKLWKEARHTGNVAAQLAVFRNIRETLRATPEGVDLSHFADVVLKLKNWVSGLNVESALDLVLQAYLKGQDPGLVEEALLLVTQSRGGFSRVDVTRMVFEYSVGQIRDAKYIWDMLPIQDQALIQVDAILSAGLEEYSDVVIMVIQEYSTLQGLGLRVGSLLKNALFPPVAFELFRTLRRPGPLQNSDLELLHQVLDAVGIRGQPGPDHVDETSVVLFS